MTDAVLMNFYIPRRLKTRLEEICDLRHLSRTSFILTTLEPEIEKWEGKIRKREAMFVHEADLPRFYSSYENEEVSGDW